MAETPPYYCPTCGMPDGHIYGCTAGRYVAPEALAKMQAALTAATQRAEAAEAELSIERQSRADYAATLTALVLLPLAAENYSDLPRCVSELLAERDDLRVKLAVTRAALVNLLTALSAVRTIAEQATEEPNDEVNRYVGGYITNAAAWTLLASIDHATALLAGGET